MLCRRSAHPGCAQPGPQLCRVDCGKNEMKELPELRADGRCHPPPGATEADLPSSLPGWHFPMVAVLLPALLVLPSRLLGLSWPPRLAPACSCTLFPPAPSRLCNHSPPGGCLLVLASNTSKEPSGPWTAVIRRIIESLRLEKTSKIITSHHQPITTMPAKPLPEVPHPQVFLNTSRDGDFTTSPGSPFQCLATLSVKKFFLISNLNLPWRNLRLISSSKFKPQALLLSASPNLLS